MSGPLEGLVVLELGGIGPIPFCTMHLADLGAEVIRIDRPAQGDALGVERGRLNLTARGKTTIALDLRRPEGRDIALTLATRAQIALEGFRPGALDKLGLGEVNLRRSNPALVIGRMSGWGRSGPMVDAAGHDINFLALSGALAAIGPADRPVPPLNLVGDFGGALFLVSGLLAALHRARETGQGQTVDASILGGALGLMSQLFTLHDHGAWVPRREANFTDGGAPFYGCYRTSDGGFMAVGAIEPAFYAALLALLDLDGRIDPARQMDRATWPETRAACAEAFARRTRADWTERASRTDACCTPVLSLDEARTHPQNRPHLLSVGAHLEPAPQPTFSGTPCPAPQPATSPGSDGATILARIGYNRDQIAALARAGVVQLLTEPPA